MIRILLLCLIFLSTSTFAAGRFSPTSVRDQPGSWSWKKFRCKNCHRVHWKRVRNIPFFIPNADSVAAAVTPQPTAVGTHGLIKQTVRPTGRPISRVRVKDVGPSVEVEKVLLEASEKSPAKITLKVTGDSAISKLSHALVSNGIPDEGVVMDSYPPIGVSYLTITDSVKAAFLLRLLTDFSAPIHATVNDR